MNSVSQVPHLHPSSIPSTVPAALSDRFERLALVPTLLRAIREQGYADPTPIQAAAIPHVLAGQDLLGCAQTGTGKTAAFALPILQRLLLTRQSDRTAQPVRALVLSPTRELAAQIARELPRLRQDTLPLRVRVIFGGVGQHAQSRRSARGVDILVATPGRLLDLDAAAPGAARPGRGLRPRRGRPHARHGVHPRRPEDHRARCPRKRQTLLFSATMPREIAEPRRQHPDRSGAGRGRRRSRPRPRRSSSASTSSAASRSARCSSTCSRTRPSTRALVFTRTKHGANRVAVQLSRARDVAPRRSTATSRRARASARSRTSRRARCACSSRPTSPRAASTSTAISHVVNFDLPDVPETLRAPHRSHRARRGAGRGSLVLRRHRANAAA